MAFPRTKLIWGGAAQHPGEWRLGLWGFYQRPAGAPRRLVVSVRGLLLWSAALVVAGYLAGATALYFWFARNPYNLVTWQDTLLMPARWQHVRELRGRMLIEEGLVDFREKRWADANMKLRVGLARFPQDLRARLALAEFYSLAARRPNAIEVLTKDLGDAYPGKKYLGTLFRLAAEGEDFEVILNACDRFLPRAGDDRSWLTWQKLTALMGLRRHEEALALASTGPAADDPMVKEARVLALIELGRGREASDFLAQWLAQSPSARAQILRLQVRTFREQKRVADMDAAWQQLRQLAPADPRSYVFGVVQRQLAGESAGAKEALEDYIRRFGGSSANLALATAALGEAKAPALVERCVQEAALHGFPPGPFKLQLAQMQMEAGDWAAAAATVDELKRAIKKPTPTDQFAVTWLERLAAVASHSDAAPRESLLEMFQQRTLPLRLYRETATVLLRAQRYQVANSLLDLAARAYPQSPTLAALREKANAGLQATTKPVADPVRTGTIPDEKAFFSQLEIAEREQRWAEAATVLHAVRAARPDWVAQRENELLEAEMRVAVRTGDMPSLLGAARLYLDGDRKKAVWVVSIAKQLGEIGRKADGELVLREVFARNPDFPPAVRLKKEWQPATEKAR